MIQSDNAVGVLDSDEDEADDFVDVSTTKKQALGRVSTEFGRVSTELR
jgi:hypothetical protein